MKSDFERLVMHSVSAILNNSGNSYSNAYTEKWLTLAKNTGCYHGAVIGTIEELKESWELWLDDNGGLPDLDV